MKKNGFFKRHAEFYNDRLANQVINRSRPQFCNSAEAIEFYDAAYPTTGAVIRSDLNAVVEEAASANVEQFIAAQVMPPYMVDEMSGTYPKILVAAGELLTAGSTVRAPGGSYGKVSRQMSEDNYLCVDRGLEEDIDDTHAKSLRRWYDAEEAAARWTLRNMQLDYEIRVAAQIFNTTNFGAATNSSVAYTAANVGTLDFPADVMAAIERVNDNGSNANTIVLNSQVLNRIKQSAKLQAMCRGALPSDATLQMSAKAIAEAFADHGITKVLIGRARYNNGKKGAAKAMVQAWGTGYVWVGEVVDGAKSLRGGGAGYTLVWNADGGLFTTETRRDENIRSNIVRVRQNCVEKIVDGSAGTLINPQYA